MQISRVMKPTPASPPVPLLLGSQTVFNLGFYAVVPFIALILARDFALGATAVGLVLGVRTFAQQGLFLLGGSFADTLGPRLVMLAGVTIRVAGFMGLAVGAHLAASHRALALAIFFAGTVLTGLGGALFSPALNLYIARADQRLTQQRQGSLKKHTTLFAWLNVTGEVGAVLGPLLGYALIQQGFSQVALVGTAIFVAIWLIFWFLLPREAPATPQPQLAQQSREILGRMVAVIKHRSFSRFAALHTVDLFCYNQLYFALPLVLASSQDSNRALALAFAALSALVLLGQLPISRLAARLPVGLVLRLGYCTSATGLLALALTQHLLAGGSAPSSLTYLLVVGTALLIGCGHLFSSPQGLSHVANFAPPQAKAAYLGLLATYGGLVVLVGNLALGLGYDLLGRHLPGSQWLIWVATALCVLLAACLQRPLSRATR